MVGAISAAVGKLLPLLLLLVAAAPDVVATWLLAVLEPELADCEDGDDDDGSK